MQKFVRWLRKDQSGFTLIELLVVAALLALLSAVAVPKVMAARDKANEHAANALQVSIAAALEQHYLVNSNTWPTDFKWSTDASTALASADLKADLTALGISNGDGVDANYTVIITKDTKGEVTVKVTKK